MLRHVLRRLMSMLIAPNFDPPSIFKYDENKKICGFSESYLKKRGWIGTTIVNLEAEMQSRPYEEILHHGNALGLIKSKEEYFNLKLNFGYIAYFQDQVNLWLKENCEGRWDKLGVWIVEFELEADAMLYKLTWG